ncbi:hypothetical protein L218DRAFT_949710 [Marasmius fiardii PR-910]|nr:hypothetical protein L218DRAFT_949710 [Marasmius fiardii PR-910]
MYYIAQQIRRVGNAALNVDAPALELKTTICTLLNNSKFCPEGGLFGFPLSRSYSVGPGTPKNLNDVLDWLEGRDDIVRLVCDDLGLGLSIKTVLDDPMRFDYWEKGWRGGRLLIDSAISMEGHRYPEHGLLEHFLENEAKEDLEMQVVHPYDGGMFFRCSQYNKRMPKAIAWVRPLKDGKAGYALEWPGFDGAKKSEYVDVILIVAFGPAGDRKNWKAYQAAEW